MIPISKEELKRWRVEIDQAEGFRDTQLGTYRKQGKQTTGEGINLEYFQYGSDWKQDEREREAISPALNFAFPIIKNIVPATFFRRPKALAFPLRKQDADGSPVAALLLNQHFRALDVKATWQHNTFDSFVVSEGIAKIGYATEFGIDQTRTDKEEKKRALDRMKEKLDQTLVDAGLKKPREDEEESPFVGADETIRKESPYLRWVDPFKFLKDPRCRDIKQAWWVGEEIPMTIWEIKNTKHFHRSKNELKGEPLGTEFNDVPQAEIERFQVHPIYEIHYKTDESPTGIRILTIAKFGRTSVPLDHKDSPYRMNGWQYELLSFNKHMHRLYSFSDMSVLRPILDRINNTFDAILEQVDKFYNKIAYDKSKVTPEGEVAMDSGEIGARVAVNGDPRSAFFELRMDQLKRDMIDLMNQLVDIVLIQSGITKAQLTGLSTASTATESNIQQGGQQLRRSDQANSVVDFVVRCSEKLWSVIQQFVPLEDVELMTGQESVDEQGKQRFTWLQISAEEAKKLRDGKFQFEIEVESTQQPNVAILRKLVENMANILFRPEIQMLLAREGKQVSIGEFSKIWMKLYPEIINEPSQVIKPLTQQNQAFDALRTAMQGNGSGKQGGPIANRNAKSPGQLGQSAPSVADITSNVGGNAGGGFPNA